MTIYSDEKETKIIFTKRIWNRNNTAMQAFAKKCTQTKVFQKEQYFRIAKR